MAFARFYTLAQLAVLALAQFPPAREGITWVKSPHHEGITISYKDPGICETTPGVKSYSGYVHLPPRSLTEAGEAQDYPINTFFWFFEARKDPHKAPLSIWLNGGPGGSSLLGLLAENGPCTVNKDSNSTTLNPWSWNNEVNMLYIDQPNQVGFSYDTLNNGTVNFANLPTQDDINDKKTVIELDDFSDGKIPQSNATYVVGTFASQNGSRTANSTAHAAVALWHFAQTWFEEFPEYKPHDERISMWAESYGGHYGPAFMDYFAAQNDKIRNGEIAGPGAHYLHLDTLGLVNGYIDERIQAQAYAEFSWNNTYDIRAINETAHHQQMYELYRPGGIEDQMERCQKLSGALDAGDKAIDPEHVNEVCVNATTAADIVVRPYHDSGKYAWFDITHPANDPFPSNYHLGFLQQHWVQKALGVPVNHSWVSPVVSRGFGMTGDFARGGYLEDLQRLLDGGVKVAMMYGDRDFACNWIGGEIASLAINHTQAKDFATAGYETFIVENRPPYIPYGFTRQYGNLSFTRVFQSGHMVPSYQPEASLRIFERSLFNRDIATGSKSTVGKGKTYKSEGPSDTWWRKNEIMTAPEAECYVLNPDTCTKEEMQAAVNGSAIIKDWILVGYEKDAKSTVESLNKEQAVFGEL